MTRLAYVALAAAALASYGSATAAVLLPASKGAAVTLNGAADEGTPSRCETGDYVCELIEMHTSGLLTNHKLTNLSSQLDSTWKRSVTLGVNLDMLSERVQTEIEGTIELRADVRADILFPVTSLHSSTFAGWSDRRNRQRHPASALHTVY